MNLLEDNWIRCTHHPDGTILKIAPYQITQGIGSGNPISDLFGARPDFKGALYQFLIGLLQTIAPPQKEKEWRVLWNTPPSPQDLRERFAAMAPAFDFDTDGPAFMQDHDLPRGETKPISALLIDSPGGKTLRDNLDHFIKRDRMAAMCYPCTATALFTLQTNAPSGGVGHRVGLRGGGPLTTLVDPDETANQPGPKPPTLWHKLWLNVLPEEEMRLRLEAERYGWQQNRPDSIFPWLGPARTSEKQTGQETLPTDVHPFQMYWGMPRRIRIDFQNPSVGRCDVCGDEQSPVVKRFITKNYGFNYTGIWEHPLTPYARRKNDTPPLPLHGQKGGITYRHWLGVTLGDRDNLQRPAIIVDYFLGERIRRLKMDHQARIWAFGYDMDNMKARGWYDSRMPLYAIEDSIREELKELVLKFVDAAVEMAANLSKEVKNARYKRPKDVKGDWSFIDNQFWQSTESHFYDGIRNGITALRHREDLSDIGKQFHSPLKRTAISLFDQLALGGPLADMDMGRVLKARRHLSMWLETGKKVKALLGKA